MLRMPAIKGCRPWCAPDAGIPLRPIDPHKQEVVDLCVERCPYAEAGDCCNCLGQTQAGRGRPPKATRAEIISALESGMGVRELAELFGVSLRTAQRYMKILNKKEGEMNNNSY